MKICAMASKPVHPQCVNRAVYTHFLIRDVEIQQPQVVRLSLRAHAFRCSSRHDHHGSFQRYELLNERVQMRQPLQPVHGCTSVRSLPWRRMFNLVQRRVAASVVASLWALTAMSELHEAQSQSDAAEHIDVADDDGESVGDVGTITICHPRKTSFELVNDFLSEAFARANRPSTYYIYGGYVRDSLSNAPFTDMDICMHKNVYSKLVCLLRLCDRLLTEVTYRPEQGRMRGLGAAVEYAHRKLEVAGQSGEVIVVDVTLHSSTQPLPMEEQNCSVSCDFTCNNLVLHPNGTLGMRVLPKYIRRDSSESVLYFMRCVSDAVSKRLVWMGSASDAAQGTPQQHCWAREPSAWRQLCRLVHDRRRLVHMLRKGFVAHPGERFCLPLIKGVRHLMPGDAGYDTVCVICSDPYDTEEETAAVRQDPYTVVLQCGHHFHFACISAHLKAEHSRRVREHKCPLCRQRAAVATIERDADAASASSRE